VFASTSCGAKPHSMHDNATGRRCRRSNRALFPSAPSRIPARTELASNCRGMLEMVARTDRTLASVMQAGRSHNG
jgi:hypothetical protein